MENKSLPPLRPLDKPHGLPLEAIWEAVKSIRFGTVLIIIQDGRVVQIDKTEKVRLI